MTSRRYVGLVAHMVYQARSDVLELPVSLHHLFCGTHPSLPGRHRSPDNIYQTQVGAFASSFPKFDTFSETQPFAVRTQQLLSQTQCCTQFLVPLPHQESLRPRPDRRYYLAPTSQPSLPWQRASEAL